MPTWLLSKDLCLLPGWVQAGNRTLKHFISYNNLYYGSAAANNEDRDGASRSNSPLPYYRWENFVNYSTDVMGRSIMPVSCTCWVCPTGENNFTYVSAGVE